MMAVVASSFAAAAVNNIAPIIQLPTYKLPEKCYGVKKRNTLSMRYSRYEPVFIAHYILVYVHAWDVLWIIVRIWNIMKNCHSASQRFLFVIFPILIGGQLIGSRRLKPQRICDFKKSFVCNISKRQSNLIVDTIVCRNIIKLTIQRINLFIMVVKIAIGTGNIGSSSNTIWNGLCASNVCISTAWLMISKLVHCSSEIIRNG